MPSQISRRSFLLFSGQLAALTTVGRLGGMSMAYAADANTLTSEERALVNRLTWGLNASIAKAYISKGRKTFISEQLQPGPVKLPAPLQKRIDDMLLSSKSTVELVRQIRAGMKSVKEAANDKAAAQERAKLRTFVGQLELETAERSVLRCLHSQHQFQERLTWFWSNHFNIYIRKSYLLRALTIDFEEQAIRPHVFGRFEDMLLATVRHPAMLVYLDNVRNRAGRINENYGRELMELHTLGAGGGYRQADVLALSRVLTGLGMNENEDDRKLPEKHQDAYVHDGLFEFNPIHHDHKEKRLLGERIAAGGMDEVEKVIKLLARHPSTAKHLANKLATYFVMDTPPDSLVDNMAESYSKTDGDLSAMLQTMLDHKVFQASLQELDFKDPMRYVLSGMRMLYSQDDELAINASLPLSWLGMLGERPFFHTTPDGYPIRRVEWQGSGQMAARIDVAERMGGGPARLFHNGDPPEDADSRVPGSGKALYERLLKDNVRPATRSTLKQARSLGEWNTLWLASPDFMYA